MARHKVIMRQPNELITKADIEFIIRRNDQKLGELHVSKGGIEWVPSNKKKPYRKSWTKFAQFMVQKSQVP
jgi:hypothetical protein